MKSLSFGCLKNSVHADLGDRGMRFRKKSPTSRAFALECSRALLYADIDSVLDDRLHVLLELMTTLGYEEPVFRLLKK